MASPPMGRLTRHGTGPAALGRALASQVHPVFMLPPVACSLLGAALARELALKPAALHAIAIFAAVYTAHVIDGHVDFHRRGEDDDHPLTGRGCRLALLASTLLFAVALAGLSLDAGPVALALTVPTWVIGFLHAPQLDTNPLGATLGYPIGIGLALLGGYAVQAGVPGRLPLALAAVLIVLLTGVKTVDDATDRAYDRSIGKRTLAVVLGRDRARTLAFGLVGASAVLVLGLTAEGTFPPAAALSSLVLGIVAGLAVRADDEVATMILVRGCYLFLAVLVVAVWFRPLAGAPLPDVTVLGPWTYLATEVAFGCLALWLLLRAGAVTSAARTVAVLYPLAYVWDWYTLEVVAVLYPLAYVWDWYTLEVGVFAIPMRTGAEVLGIPLEEHLFMVVVPALVVGVHETLRERR